MDHLRSVAGTFPAAARLLHIIKKKELLKKKYATQDRKVNPERKAS